MNQSAIDFLSKKLHQLKGVGEKKLQSLKKLGCNSYFDLLLHFPSSYIDRRHIKCIAEYAHGEVATIKAKVVSHHMRSRPRSYKKLFEVLARSGEHNLRITYFNYYPSIKNLYPVGAEIILSSKLQLSAVDGYQMQHPDKVGFTQMQNQICKIEPIYPLAQGLWHGFIAGNIKLIMRNITPDFDPMPKHIIDKFQLPSWYTSIADAHFPNDPTPQALSNAKQRLAFDEIVAHIAAIRAIKAKNIAPLNRSDIQTTPKVSQLTQQCIDSLPFKLTDGQQKILAEIQRDMDSATPCKRLIQGDVGSGKTVIALLSAIHAISKGQQAVILAPTEVLANQHYDKLQPILSKLGVSSALLISAITAKNKSNIKEQIAAGNIQLVIGTHAILQDDVNFANLGLVVFDEQHKFGVMQRQTLLKKGNNVGYIMMSATPIPRTLSLVAYADMNISILADKPQGRKPINTIALSEGKTEELIAKLGQFISRGEKVFWLCPLVEENDELNLTDIASRFQSIYQFYPGNVGFIHGKMKAVEKEQQMRDLLSSKIHILVATTVIEVGVDVSDATLMVIEHSERYGLSQLHQLRGRIGRGDKEGTCILLHKKNLNDVAKQRLSVMKCSSDGFYIADQDLKLRGEGDLAGLRQSGVPNFRFFDPLSMDGILEKALKTVDSSQDLSEFNLLIKLYKPEIS